jgi:hypothetical protein
MSAAVRAFWARQQLPARLDFGPQIDLPVVGRQGLATVFGLRVLNLPSSGTILNAAASAPLLLNWRWPSPRSAVSTRQADCVR